MIAKVKLKLFPLILISLIRETSYTQKEIRNLLASQETKEQKKIQPIFAEKTGKELLLKNTHSRKQSEPAI